MHQQNYGNIISTATAIPVNPFKTTETIATLGERISDDLRSSINQLGVGNRSSIVEDYPDYLIGKAKRKLISTTTDLGVEAVEKCLTNAKIDPAQICLLISITNTANRHLPCFGYEVRSKLPNLIPADINIINMQDQGCAVLLKAVEVAQQYLKDSPEKYVIIVASEGHTGFIPQLTEERYQGFREIIKGGGSELQLMHTMTIIESFLFGDGAIALLIGVNDDYSMFGPITHLTDVEEKDLDLIHMNEGGILHPAYSGFPHYIMSSSVPARGAFYAKKVTQQLFDNPEASLHDTDHADLFLIHTGSKKILNGVCHTLNIPADSEKVATSFEILRENGNLSSASIGFMINKCLEDKKKGNALLITFGVGFSGSGGILCFR